MNEHTRSHPAPGSPKRQRGVFHGLGACFCLFLVGALAASLALRASSPCPRPLAASLALRASDRPQHGLRVPDGFEVSVFADEKLANDIHCMTLDPAGRVVVAGKGYLRLLVDDDGDGKADRALDFAAAPKDGAMGLFWEGHDLYCVGDGGLRVYRDAGGAGRLEPSQLLFPCRTGGEHLAHAVCRGPDGWLYLLVGDQARIGKEHITLPTSPIREPVGGGVLRFSPDFKDREVVADGFRNAYGMDFNPDGELFTFDSDNERCVSLPWYEPTRCYHVHSGGRHGWQAPQHAATWRQPPHFVDVVPPVATLGRGSPTGVLCYRHTQFPARYRGGLFLLDWTFGQVHFVGLTRHGSSYRGRPEVFLHSVGDEGFAPTAAAVHPRTGDLFLAIGGRGTRGAVYRVRYPAGLKALRAEDVARQHPAKRSLDWRPGLDKELLRDVAGRDEHACRQALELIARHQTRFTAAQIERAVRATAGHADRGIRHAAARLLAVVTPKEQERIGKLLESPLARTTLYLARPDERAADLIKDRRLPAPVRLDAARLLQCWLGDVGAASGKGTVWEGYTRRSPSPGVPDEVRAALRSAFPSRDPLLDAELARCLALVEDDDPDTLRKMAEFLDATGKPVDEIHCLIALARLKAPRSAEVTRAVAGALLGLDRKVTARKLHRERNWPLRIAELHAGLAGRDPALNGVLLAHAEFGRPDHALFTRCPGFDRKAAARRFLTRAAGDGDFAWNAELVALVGELPAEQALPVLRKLWGEHGLDEDLLSVLGRMPRAEDRDRFVTGLGSARLATLRTSLAALEKLGPPAGKEHLRDEAFALVRALRQLGTAKEEERLRERLVARLGRISGERWAKADDWLAWLKKSWPELAARLDDADGVDVAGWQKRLGRMDWGKGDAKRGSGVYVKASCAACHGGSAALGPDLHGVTGRFSRDDLFTAIVRPSKDVSPRYRTTQLVTARGQVYQGLIVYEAADSVLLLTGPGQTVRLAHQQIGERRLTATSLMPAGLLDRLSDGEVSDLYAYLKSLKGK